MSSRLNGQSETSALCNYTSWYILKIDVVFVVGVVFVIDVVFVVGVVFVVFVIDVV